jgi:hypothetical protein
MYLPYTEPNSPCGKVSSLTYNEYTVAITTDAGRKKIIVEKDSRRDMYDYLNVGDKVRYHPKFGTYEKSINRKIALSTATCIP